MGDVVVRYDDGSTYEGPYISEACLDPMGDVRVDMRQPHHWGRWTAPSEDVYEGFEVDNHFNPALFNGTCRWTKATGEVYEGQFLDGLPHGDGVCLYADGSRYEGVWFKGLRWGYGVSEISSVLPDEWRRLVGTHWQWA